MTKMLPLPLSLLLAANAHGVQSITTDEGDTYNVPEGASVYIAEAPVFSLRYNEAGDLNLTRLSTIGGESVDDPVVFTPEEPECTIEGSIKWDPETSSWRFCGGTGWAIDGPEMQAAGENYNARKDAFLVQIGDYEQYLGGSPELLASKLRGNYWWYTRLDTYADQVMAGDTSRFRKEFWGRGPKVAEYALEVLNRYIALLVDGYTHEELDEIIWGDG